MIETSGLRQACRIRLCSTTLITGCLLCGLLLGLAGGAGCRISREPSGFRPTEPQASATPKRTDAIDPAFYPEKLAEMDADINKAISEHRCPGGVLWLEHRGASYHKAYGNRALVAQTEPMTEDTIFDAASLTKVVACTPAVMLLVERGQINLDERVQTYIPEFKGGNKEAITVRQLMLHISGLRGDIETKSDWHGQHAAIEKACNEKLQSPPGTEFRYSDINFFLLGEIVQRVSHTPLEQFVARELYKPLKMADTGYLPPESKLGRIAPTEVVNGKPYRGVVHDPTARKMGGVAGHAGLFFTAADLARYARMLLNEGSLDGVRIFKPQTVRLMTSVQTPDGFEDRRGLGWDIDSGYSGPRGKVFPLGSYGHTGWTGTSLWIDPFSKTFVIFLSNRNHPDESGNVQRLRSTLGTLAAEAVPDFNFAYVPGALAQSRPGVSSAPRSPRANRPETNAPASTPTPDTRHSALPTNLVAGLPDAQAKLASSPQPSPPEEEREKRGIGSFGGPNREGLRRNLTLNGIDVLVRDKFAPLKGLRLGLITNHTGHDRARNPTIDLLKNAPGVELKALFSPEHGIRGVMDEHVGDSTDEKTGLPIYSLYGATFKPKPEQLADLDALVFDIQDVGCRFYTYTATMGLTLEAAGQNGKKYFVLDRVDPINGVTIDGPVRDGEGSFVAFHNVPLRYAMTIGELARMCNTERNCKADLTVIQVENWKRDLCFDQTGLPWTNPSPNMRTLTEAILYPGIGLLESALSVGRGTDTPFEVVGAPYIDDVRLASELNSAGLPGAQFVPVRFTPTYSVHKGQLCGGVSIVLTDRDRCSVVDVGLQIAETLYRLYPTDFKPEKMARLLKHEPTIDAIKAGKPLSEIRAAWKKDLDEFQQRRAKYLIY